MLGKGKILRIKCGYNPNSSSIGTNITMFLHGAFLTSLITSIAVPLILAWRRKKKNTK